MAREQLARAMVETMLSKALKDIKNDPERGFRNTVDLVLNIQGGNFSKTLFGLVQKMLTDQSSAYYRLIKSIADNVDNDYFKTFTLNLGYNGCVSGAKKLRAKEDELGISLPWCISICSSNDEAWPDFADSIISQGKALGVYIYQICGEMALSDQAVKLYKKYEDCAFVIFAESAYVTDKSISKLKKIDNILISITSDSFDDMYRASDVLNKYERFFATHMIYDDNNYAELFFDTVLKSMENFTNSFVFYAPDLTCSQDVYDKAKNLIRSIRDSQHYAYVIMDMKSDIIDIDKSISPTTSSIAFNADGTVSSAQKHNFKENYSLTNTNLIDILK